MESAAEVRHLAAAVGGAGRGRGRTGPARSPARQIEQLRAHVDDIDFEAAARYERKLRHDVMAHVHAYGDQCPEARPIIHLGATSCYVTDNTDLLLLREGLQMIARGTAGVIDSLAAFRRQAPRTALPGLHPPAAGPAHDGGQAGLPLGARLHARSGRDRAPHRRPEGLGQQGHDRHPGQLPRIVPRRPRQGAASSRKLICRKIGFDAAYPVSGQTYSRKIDAQVLGALSGVAQSAHKMATDLRLLAHRREVEEPFEPDQVGSSAMAYKRNPMRSERICSLSRFVMSLESSAAQTAAVQWLERTLDDSANRRLVLPQAFLAADAVLMLCQNVTAGLVVYPKVIAAHLEAELPLMATENILMAAVAAGGDRQDLHERIRRHSRAAAAVVKEQGGMNDLMARLAGDPAFAGVDLAAALDPAEVHRPRRRAGQRVSGGRRRADPGEIPRTGDRRRRGPAASK